MARPYVSAPGFFSSGDRSGTSSPADPAFDIHFRSGRCQADDLVARRVEESWRQNRFLELDIFVVWLVAVSQLSITASPCDPTAPRATARFLSIALAFAVGQSGAARLAAVFTFLVKPGELVRFLVEEIAELIKQLLTLRRVTRQIELAVLHQLLQLLAEFW